MARLSPPQKTLVSALSTHAPSYGASLTPGSMMTTQNCFPQSSARDCMDMPDVLDALWPSVRLKLPQIAVVSRCASAL
jgi:hypothetical protein